MTKNFYITTPIYYVNAKPHIGSIYTTIIVDTINRFQRLNGCNVYFLTGTDEHGLKLQQTAEKENKTPQQLVDEITQFFKDLVKDFKIENDDFIRTTEQRHKKFVQKIWKVLVENDWIYKGKYSGWYCVSDEAYYGENELVRGEDGKFKTTIGKDVEWREEDSYFFRLSEFQDILLKIYQQNENLVQPESRRNETIAFVGGNDIKAILNGNYEKGYLKDLSVSRNNFDWGIKISCDDKQRPLLKNTDEWVDGLKDEEKHVIYVWLDALFNYWSAIEDDLQNRWYNGKVVHIVGKDIMKFHTVYWPAFLIAVKYNRQQLKTITVEEINKSNVLPTTVFAHGWWMNEGRKMSKSFGNIIDPYQEIDWLVNDYSIDRDIAIDYFKYYLTTDGIFGNDLDYSRERFVNRINSELVNNIGNLIQRVFSMVYKHFAGDITTINSSTNQQFNEQFSNLDILLKNDTLNKFDFEEYKNLVISLSNFANDYMEKTAPWNLAKTGKIEELKKVLEFETSLIIKIAILLQVFCPYISTKILDFLNIKDRNFENINEIVDLKITEPKGFFPRLEKR